MVALFVSTKPQSVAPVEEEATAAEVAVVVGVMVVDVVEAMVVEEVDMVCYMTDQLWFELTENRWRRRWIQWPWRRRRRFVTCWSRFLFCNWHLLQATMAATPEEVATPEVVAVAMITSKVAETAEAVGRWLLTIPAWHAISPTKYPTSQRTERQIASTVSRISADGDRVAKMTGRGWLFGSHCLWTPWQVFF